MFTFQSIMFVSLGFLCALLVGFVVAPAFWARAVRLTTERMRASVPLTEREIAAERDRLRAENAIRVHQLSAKIERGRLYDARQKVEINRRDGTIGALKRRLETIETEREGSENARRVLEATITQRVPEVEARLMEARQLLAKRDAEMKDLQSDTGRTFKALDDAMQINAQQRAEIDRLKMSLAGQGVRVQGPVATESETALRAEIEKLRARSREQAALIVRLQAEPAEKRGAVGPKTNGAGKGSDAAFIPLQAGAANDDDAGGHAVEYDGLADGRRAEIEWFKAKIEEQSGTIEKLTAQLDVYEQDAKKNGRSLSLRDSKAALKSRVTALERQVEDKEAAIAGLRRDLATANERIARQASHYQDEFRRLGSRHAARNAVTAERATDGAHEAAAPEDAARSSSGALAPANGANAADDPSGASRAPEQIHQPNIPTDAPAAQNDAGDSIGRDHELQPGPAREQAEPSPASSQRRGKLMDRIAELAKR